MSARSVTKLDVIKSRAHEIVGRIVVAIVSLQFDDMNRLPANPRDRRKPPFYGLHCETQKNFLLQGVK
jgi:hypothetical protein